jgi:hypothetical protein
MTLAENQAEALARLDEYSIASGSFKSAILKS